MDKFEDPKKLVVNPGLDGIDLNELTKKLVESGVAGSKKEERSEGHDFMREGKHIIVNRADRSSGSSV